MRPINLLPPYIYDKQKKVQLAGLWGLITLGVIGGFIYWQMQINKDLEAAVAEKQEAEKQKAEYDRQVALIAAENQKIAEIKQKQDFIAAAQKYNDQWAEGYSLIRDVTSPNVILRRISIEPNLRKNVSFAGAARQEMDIIKWWMALKNDQERFESVKFELPPHAYNPGGGAGAAGTGAGRFAGGPGGFGGPGSGGFGGSRGPGVGGPMAASISSPGGGGGPTSFGGGASGFGGGPGSGGSFGGGRGGFGGGGGAQSAEVGPGILEGRPVINFVATAVLKKPLAEGVSLPAWPASGGGGGGGATGGFGSPGGGPGGFGSPGGGAPGGFSGGPGGLGAPGGGKGGGSTRTAD